MVWIVHDYQRIVRAVHVGLSLSFFVSLGWHRSQLPAPRLSCAMAASCSQGECPLRDRAGSHAGVPILTQNFSRTLRRMTLSVTTAAGSLVLTISHVRSVAPCVVLPRVVLLLWSFYYKVHNYPASN